MKVTLVYPATIRFGTSGSPPLGVLYVASYLRNHDIDCDVFDMNFSSWSDFQIMLRKRKPDVVGFSVTTPIAERGFKAAKMVREILPNSKIVFGGPHATVDPIGTKEHADIVVMGEGEITMFNILKEIGAGNNVNGIILGEVVKNLDDLPFPDRKMVDMKKYPSHSLMASRGCPYNCLYCQPTQRKLFGNKVKFRSVSDVMNEIDWIISEFGRSKEFYSLDDVFTINKDWVFDFCKEIRKRKIAWMCITRVSLVDDRLLSAMASAGCVRIFYGVESGSQRILNFMRKGITIKQIKNAFKLTHKNGILANAFLMVGTPTETKEDLELTAKLIGEIHPDAIQISITTPLVGTDLYSYCENRNRLNFHSLAEYDYFTNKYPIKLDDLTEEDLSFHRKKIMDSYRRNLYKNMAKYLQFLIKSKQRGNLIRNFLTKIKG